MKKLVSLGLVLTLALGVISQGARAEEVNGDISPEEGFKGNGEDFYDTDKEINYWHEYPPAEEKINGDISPEEGFKGNGEDFYKQDKMLYVPEGYVGYNKQVQVPVYLQKTIDFGGPACVEMVIDYILGPTANQESYAQQMGTNSNGTYIEEMVKALNSSQNSYTYDKVSLDSEYHFVKCLMETLDKGYPVIADISTTNQHLLGRWDYSMPGHYVLVAGLEVDENENTYLTVLDPYKLGTVKVKLETFYSMITDHWDRAIIY